jgi:hypothetical protein
MAAAAPGTAGFAGLPIQPEDGFPQAFLLSMEGRLYRLTFSVSFLSLEPFRPRGASGQAERAPAGERTPSVPLDTDGPRAPLPWPLPDQADARRYALPQDGLYLVMRVEREDLPADRRVQGITRPVLGLPFRVGDLVFLFTTIEIARGNLIGSGSFGSRVVAGVRAHG